MRAGDVIAGHRLIAPLAWGGSGEVWHAQFAGQDVAVKFFTRGARPGRIRREAIAQYALSHLSGPDGRWFPRVEHIDGDASPPYMRMELVHGPTLEAWAQEPRTIRERLQVARQVLEALEAVHRHGFVHGDLSPSNVIVSADGVRLLDVGFGALIGQAGDVEVSSGEEAYDRGVAAVLYAAPERFDDAAPSPAADIFSFGKLLYFTLTGEKPYAVKPLSWVIGPEGEKWDEFLFRCTETDPAARYPSAQEALAAWRVIAPESDEDRDVVDAHVLYRVRCPECRGLFDTPAEQPGAAVDCEECGASLRIRKADPRTGWAESESDEPVAECVALPRESLWFGVLLTLVGYAACYVPGLMMNFFFLEEAKRIRERTGAWPSGSCALGLMRWLFFYVPLLILAVFVVVSILTAFPRASVY